MTSLSDFDATETDTDVEGQPQDEQLPIISMPDTRGAAYLPPVEGREDQTTQDPYSKPLPPIEQASAMSTSTQGGVPAQAAKDTIISVPEGGGFHPQQTEKAIISVPGKPVFERAAFRKSDISQRSTLKPIEIVVYFMDKTGINLMVEDGQHAEAGELFEMVIDEMRYPAVAREAFSLWLVSDLLELQLKPNQVPFKLVCYWEELLEKYTTADEEDIERDEPVIMFQRNVFYPKSKETQLSDYEMVRLLFNEAKENVVDARYPVSMDDCDYLAGIQALLINKMYDCDYHTPEFYRNTVSDYYPAHFCKKKWSFPGFKSKDNPEYRLAESHHIAYRKYGSIKEKSQKAMCHKAYLEYCWKLPYYGSAFFKGQIEHPGSKLRIRSLQDDPVYVAINTEGVFLIDMDDVEFLLGMDFKAVSWEYGEPKERDNPDCIPCLFLQFKTFENGESVTKLLQVFSREAMLMDAMIESSIKLNQMTQHRGGDVTDGAAEKPGDQSLMQSTGETWSRFNRLCLATFDKKGLLRSNTVRQPRQ